MKAMQLSELLDLMRQHTNHEGWWPHESPFEIMVGAILVQQTTWEKTYAVIIAMRRAGLMEPQALAESDQQALEDVVRPCGFYRQKTARVKRMASWVVAKGGMTSVARMDTGSLREELLSLDGVGKETSDAMLAFAFHRPRFVAAAYAIRVLRRTGVMPSVDYDTAQTAVQAWRGDDAAALRSDYAAFVEIAKNHCRQKPKCGACPLHIRCVYANG